MQDNESLMQKLWKEIQTKFIEIIEQNLNKNNDEKSKYYFYNKNQVKEMSYFFKYTCLENKQLIKKTNFNIYNILLI